jgi:hypothetical protein
MGTGGPSRAAPLWNGGRAKSETLKAIVGEYVAREGDRLRTMDERKSVLERLVLPKLVTE